MPRFPFFASVEQINQWLGNLFYRKVSPTELQNMNYHELKYWNSWHEILAKEEKKAVESLKKGD
jgi:hypothetical protein